MSWGAAGLTGFGSTGGVSGRGLVTSELDGGLVLGGGPLGMLVGRGGRGRILGIERFVIGPTITLGGTILGAGAGMYGCFSPPESETAGALLGGDDGVKIPLDSPMNLGLSSQHDAAWPGS